MKNLFYAITLLAICSCGTSNSEQASEGLSQEEEQALADSIATVLTTEMEELNQTTEESLQEIDSLLETL